MSTIGWLTKKKKYIYSVYQSPWQNIGEVNNFFTFQDLLNAKCHYSLSKMHLLDPIFFFLIHEIKMVKYFMVLQTHDFTFLWPFSTYTEKWTKISSTMLNSFFEKQVIICHDIDMVFHQLIALMAFKYFKSMHSQGV